ncbi:hypothetical protein [Nocardia asiatica]|uniref:hypothetical protein n=1 Tax=Nocardia asiatica TaxID=209252 RepID=UPI0024541C0E|nr:hypothetical protein [Nocardia asiatica]
MTDTNAPTVTRNEALLASKVLAGINSMLGYGSVEWWSPNQLRELIDRVPEETGREQIRTTIRVLQVMLAERGHDDSVGYAPIVVRDWAEKLPAAGDKQEDAA